VRLSSCGVAIVIAVLCIWWPTVRMQTHVNVQWKHTCRVLKAHMGYRRLWNISFRLDENFRWFGTLPGFHSVLSCDQNQFSLPNFWPPVSSHLWPVHQERISKTFPAIYFIKLYSDPSFYMGKLSINHGRLYLQPCFWWYVERPSSSWHICVLPELFVVVYKELRIFFKNI